MIWPFEVEIDRLKLRGWRRPGSGPRCLAVHGWLDNAGSFSRLIEFLPDWDFLALDLPGHGQSDYLPEPGFYHFIDGVHWVNQLLRAWGPVILMGHSLGGGLSTMAAGIAPENVTQMVLLDALGPITSPAEEAPQLFLRSLAGQSKPFRRRYYPTWQEALARLEIEGRSSAAAAALAQRSLRCDSHGYYFAYDPRVKLVSRARLTEDQIRSYMRLIQCPVLVFQFSRGILSNWPPLQERLQCLQRVELALLEGGHHHHLECPEEVARKILAWIA